MAIVAVSITPVGEGIGVSRYVSAAERVLRAQSEVQFRLDPMFTTLEGDLDQIFALIRQMQEAVFSEGPLRVGTVIKIDDRRDREATMEGKLAAVEARLREPDSS